MTVAGTVEAMVAMTMVVCTIDLQDAHHIEVAEVTPPVGHHLIMVVDQEGSGQDLFLIRHTEVQIEAMVVVQMFMPGS